MKMVLNVYAGQLSMDKSKTGGPCIYCKLKISAMKSPTTTAVERVYCNRILPQILQFFSPYKDIKCVSYYNLHHH